MVDKIQPVEDPEPRRQLVIEDLGALKVLSHPLRLQILELMTYEPRTVKQIAAALNLSPNKLYYHVNLLEEHGFIQLVDVRMVSGILEKHYRVSAYDFTLKEGLLKVSEPEGEERITSLVESVLDRTKEDIKETIRRRAMREGRHERQQMSIHTGRARMSRERALEFSQRLKELGEEFEKEEEGDGGEGQIYALTTLLYPTYLGSPLEPKEEQESE